MTNSESKAQQVIVGVDTHKYVHVAVAIDTQGIRLGDHAFVANAGGYRVLIRWADTHGQVEAFGVEGTGSYGAGLTWAVRRAGHRVVEVNRGNRRTRRTAGKSDTIDAEVAARSVLAGQSTATPKTADGVVEMMRQLKIARDTAVKARTAAMITLKPLVVHAPPQLREALHALTDRQLLTRCAALRPGLPRHAHRVRHAHAPVDRSLLVHSRRGNHHARPTPHATHDRDVALPVRELRSRRQHRRRVVDPLRR